MISNLTDGSCSECEIVGPVEIRFKTRKTIYIVVVIPSTLEVLLGAIPLEDMDAIIDLKKQELTLPPDRPYIARTRV